MRLFLRPGMERKRQDDRMPCFWGTRPGEERKSCASGPKRKQQPAQMVAWGKTSEAATRQAGALACSRLRQELRGLLCHDGRSYDASRTAIEGATGISYDIILRTPLYAHPPTVLAEISMCLMLLSTYRIGLARHVHCGGSIDGLFTALFTHLLLVIGVHCSFFVNWNCLLLPLSTGRSFLFSHFPLSSPPFTVAAYRNRHIWQERDCCLPFCYSRDGANDGCARDAQCSRHHTGSGLFSVTGTIVALCTVARTLARRDSAQGLAAATS